MKKLARLTALLLTGALLLVLTACGAVVEPETEQQAKQRLLEEINSYRASIHLDPLEEVKQLCQKAKQMKPLMIGAARLRAGLTMMISAWS